MSDWPASIVLFGCVQFGTGVGYALASAHPTPMDLILGGVSLVGIGIAVKFIGLVGTTLVCWAANLPLTLLRPAEKEKGE